jgi:hypothetical protein
MLGVVGLFFFFHFRVLPPPETAEKLFRPFFKEAGSKPVNEGWRRSMKIVLAHGEA